MSHAYHEGLPGYAPGSIWHDGCAECEERAANIEHGLGYLDERRFAQAWRDMIAEKWTNGDALLEQAGFDPSQPSRTRQVSALDWRLMNHLYAVAVVLERCAGQDPVVTLAAVMEMVR